MLTNSDLGNNINPLSIMDPSGLPMYQNPCMTMMGQCDNGTVPGSIPINYQTGNPDLRSMGMQGAPMSDNHDNFNQKSHVKQMTAQQHYPQLPGRKEVDEEGRICAGVLPKTPAHLPTEENDMDHLPTEENYAAHLPTEENDDGLLKVSQENVKTEEEDDMSNFVEAAHDIFLKVSMKELNIQEASDLLGQPYSFVYSRYQEFCDNITGKVTTKKRMKGAITKENGKKKRRSKKLITSKRKSGKILQCQDCPAIFHTDYLLKAHSKVHLENNESHLCTACGIVFSKLGLLMTHRLKIHDNALQCPHCEKQYTKITSYKFHINTHSKERPFVCDECGKGFFSRVSLEDHYRQHTGEKPFMCGYCEKTFIAINNLKKHQKVHIEKANRPERKKRAKKPPKNFECQECGKGHKTKYRLEQHMNIHTGAKPHACDLCDARFNLQANLTRHKMIHTGEKPFKCNYCPAAFLRKIDLKRHDMAHTGIKPFKCSLCDYSCVKKTSLEYHMNTHEGKTPFKCDFYGCSVEYSNPNTLKQHKLKHCPPPLKSCKVCNEKFPDLNSLKRHMIIHPGNEPLSCDQCDKIFYNESTLNRHMHVHMYKPPGNKVKHIRQKRKNPGVQTKRVDKSVTTQKKLPFEYQAPAVAENGHSSIAQSWTINAEDTNNRYLNSQQFHQSFSASQFTNLNAWPSTMDPDELRQRLLSSFK